MEIWVVHATAERFQSVGADGSVVEVARALGVAIAHVSRTQTRFVEGGPDALYDRRRDNGNRIPSGGGVAARIAANDPPACSGHASPGVTKWAPSVAQASGGRTFYGLVFSSTRTGSFSQLYVTPVVVTEIPPMPPPNRAEQSRQRALGQVACWLCTM